MGNWSWILSDVLIRMGPALVGLVLLLRRPSRERWWRWGMLAFGLVVLVGVANILSTSVLLLGQGPDMPGLGSGSWVTFTFSALSVVSFVASCFGVAAVLADRNTAGPEDPRSA